MSRADILASLVACMKADFEVAPEQITLEARLYEDLDLDSIDAVDLMVRLQELTGRKMRPEQFKSTRTVSDVIDRVQELMEA